jgi:hypothetical protein
MIMSALASRPYLRAGASRQHGFKAFGMSHFLGIAFHCLKSEISSQKAIQDISG